MDLIEDIGPILGIVAFLGFAILALLIVLQAREVRRLREWAGRAPERSAEADEAALAASDLKGELQKPEKPTRIQAVRNRFASLRTRTAEAFAPRWVELDRRSPVDPRIVLVILTGVVVAAVVTSGFGLLGGEAPETDSRTQEEEAEPVEVAVLNATAQPGVADPVVGIADLVAKELVKPADFEIGAKTNAPTGEPDSVVMFEPEAEADAEELAAAVEEGLGNTQTEPITEAVRDQADGATVVLLVGVEDSTFGEETP
jgi:hypothetical protein